MVLHPKEELYALAYTLVLRQYPAMNVEECLREITGKAALLRYMASSATLNPEHPDPAVLAGMGEVCGDIEQRVRAVKKALDVDALGLEVRRLQEVG